MTRPRPRPHALAAAMVALVILGSGATRAEDELVTDRPDQTESAVTIAPGKIQVETGALFTRDERGRSTLEVTEALGTLVRIGLDERFELRVGFDGFVFAHGASGLGDAAIGAKILLAEEEGKRPQAAVLLGTSVPIGDDRFTSDDYAPSVRLALSRDFGESLGVGFNVGAEFPEDEEILIYTLAAGVALDELHGVFFEIFGDSESSHSLDAGWTFLARPNLQLDVAVGAGISSEAPDWFAGVGVSVRLPD